MKTYVDADGLLINSINDPRFGPALYIFALLTPDIITPETPLTVIDSGETLPVLLMFEKDGLCCAFGEAVGDEFEDEVVDGLLIVRNGSRESFTANQVGESGVAFAAEDYMSVVEEIENWTS